MLFCSVLHDKYQMPFCSNNYILAYCSIFIKNLGFYTNKVIISIDVLCLYAILNM